MIIDAEKFALAVVSSSSSELSIKEKIKLYEDAVQTVKDYNQPQIENQQQQNIDNAEAFLKIF
ncbi:hypothetical protein [Streptococcus sp. sy004]|uniref:hypothetical protein n=1 Tax=Streptococcus sp. sy004 TaxID=2600149 RepID=UPI0011B49927|nr:hypothetical protein [Streptococcus sp. sy004]TWT12048.1 hypothetical protein FRX54_00495 [Streptococcus sp. sy004]